MGQCYTVYLKIKFKDAGEFVRLTQQYATSHNWSADYMASTTSIDKIVKFFVGVGDSLTVDYEDGWPVFRGDYDASYSWDGVLEEWFRAIAPSLEPGSEIDVWPDSGSWNCTVNSEGAVDKQYGEDDEEEDDEI